MIHLSEFRIHRFRGLRDVTLAGLGDFNLLVGPNNSGKSSILEAVACHLNPQNIEVWLLIGRLREVKSSRTSQDYSLSKLFPQTFAAYEKELKSGWIALDSQRPDGCVASLATYQERVAIGGTDETETGAPQRRRSFSLDVLKDYTFTTDDLNKIDMGQDKPEALGRFSTMRQEFGDHEISLDKITRSEVDLNYEYVGTATHRTAKETIDGVSRAILAGYREQLVALLRHLDSRVVGAEVSELDGQPSNINLTFNDGYSPLSLFGDGIRRLVHIIGAAARAKNGILLIDEVEIGLHAGVMSQVLPRLIDLCKAFNVQIIATTHSLEAIDGFIEGLDAAAAGPTLYRLPDRAAENKTVKRFEWSDVKLMRSEYGMEVR